MTVNRLATPLDDSVLDRYFAEHPDEKDFRRHKTASVNPEPEIEREGSLDPEAFEQVFEQ